VIRDAGLLHAEFLAQLVDALFAVVEDLRKLDIEESAPMMVSRGGKLARSTW
jgi:hypothetical protein